MNFLKAAKHTELPVMQQLGEYLRHIASYYDNLYKNTEGYLRCLAFGIQEENYEITDLDFILYDLGFRKIEYHMIGQSYKRLLVVFKFSTDIFKIRDDSLLEELNKYTKKIMYDDNEYYSISYEFFEAYNREEWYFETWTMFLEPELTTLLEGKIQFKSRFNFIYLSLNSIFESFYMSDGMRFALSSLKIGAKVNKLSDLTYYLRLYGNKSKIKIFLINDKDYYEANTSAFWYIIFGILKEDTIWVIKAEDKDKFITKTCKHILQSIMNGRQLKVYEY